MELSLGAGLLGETNGEDDDMGHVDSRQPQSWCLVDAHLENHRIFVDFRQRGHAKFKHLEMAGALAREREHIFVHRHIRDRGSSTCISYLCSLMMLVASTLVPRQSFFVSSVCVFCTHLVHSSLALVLGCQRALDQTWRWQCCVSEADPTIRCSPFMGATGAKLGSLLNRVQCGHPLARNWHI